MNAPPVQYVKTSDGYDIAYAVSGSGQPLVLVGNAGFEHVQLAWQMPELQDWLKALSERFTLVQIDPRGAGMSTRGLPDDLTMDHYQLDIDAVVNHLRLERFLLYGALFHLSYMPVQYAVEHPERIAGLILCGVGTSLAAYRTPALFDTISGQDWDLFLHFMIRSGGGPPDPEEEKQIVDLWKQAHDQKSFFHMAQVAGSMMLDGLLERLVTPTVVIYPRGYDLLIPEEARKVGRLARARLVTIDGRTPLALDAEQGMRAVESFLADLPPPLNRQPAARDTLPDDLSEREVEVLKLLAQGKSNPEIAKELFITRNTVQNHVSSILIKTNLNNRAQAAVYAQQYGLI
jgi:DNA-binding CsgD family transcriptional regulator/pimeloyl-ACP methyl ester carboxylesterase